MLSISKTPSSDDGVQFNFEDLPKKVAEKEVCQYELMNACNNNSKFYRSQITLTIMTKTIISKLNCVQMGLNIAGNATFAFYCFLY